MSATFSISAVDGDENTLEFSQKILEALRDLVDSSDTFYSEHLQVMRPFFEINVANVEVPGFDYEDMKSGSISYSSEEIAQALKLALYLIKEKNEEIRLETVAFMIKRVLKEIKAAPNIRWEPYLTY
ncbi:MAG: hypothetical protein JXR26_01470 [Balneolaceae bacterium]|nr:hypothetical protein [Balneolaceae bacterium]